MLNRRKDVVLEEEEQMLRVRKHLEGRELRGTCICQRSGTQADEDTALKASASSASHQQNTPGPHQQSDPGATAELSPEALEPVSNQFSFSF